MKKIAIIGAGASGLWAALSLSHYHNRFDITIYERLARPGKKLAMSGNSRGNLTNINVRGDAYNDPYFVKDILNNMPPSRLINQFETIGIKTVIDEQGRVYPLSESAQSVVDVIVKTLANRGVHFIYEKDVTNIKSIDKKYAIDEDIFDYVMFATGSKAGLSSKTPLVTFPSIDGVHAFKMKPLVPALCAIGVIDDIKMLQGQRVRAKMTLETTSGTFTSEGELQFIDHALSGIAMFELSSYYAREIVQGIDHRPTITLDLMPSLSDQQLYDYLSSHIGNNPLTISSLEGILAPKLSQWLYHRFLKKIGSIGDLNKLGHLIKYCRLSLDTQYVPKSYQIMAGGIDTSQIDKKSLQSHRHSNLFIGGEVLDVDGLCGGYNLHFAFASGQLIAQTILKKEGITYEENDRFNRP